MKKLILLIFIFFNLATNVDAKNLYVDVASIGGTCSDAYTYANNSITQPFCTIQRSADVALVAGDVVIVRDGTYTDTDYDDKIVSIVSKNGTAVNWITFKSENALGAKLDGQLVNWTHVTGWTNDGGSVYWATVTHNVNYVRSGCIRESTAQYCIPNTAPNPNLNGLDIGHKKASRGAVTSTHDFYYDSGAQKLYYYEGSPNTRYIIATEGPSYGFNVASSSYLRFEGFEIKNLIGNGFYLGGNNFYMFKNKLHDFTRFQFLCEQPGNTYGLGSATFFAVGSSYITFDSNYVYNTGRLPASCQNDYNHDQMMYIDAHDHIIVINNIFANNLAGWLSLDGTDQTAPDGVSDIVISNNIFYGKNPGKNGHIDVRFRVKNLTIQNNISYTPGAYFIEDDTLHTFNFPDAYGNQHYVYNNIVYSSGIILSLFNYNPTKNWTWSGNTINVDPALVDPTNATPDFHLGATSIAIDSGVDASLYTSLDYDGNARPVNSVYDIGAYERASGTPAVTLYPKAPLNFRISSGAPPPPPNPNLLVNGDFEGGSLSSWTFYTNTSGSATANAPGYGGAGYAAKITDTPAGTNVQFYQTGVIIENATQYRVQFDAYSSTGDNLTIQLIKHGSPYTNYGLLSENINLTTGWAHYSIDFTSNTAATDGRFRFVFDQYDTSGDIFYIDNVEIRKL